MLPHFSAIFIDMPREWVDGVGLARLVGTYVIGSGTRLFGVLGARGSAPAPEALWYDKTALTRMQATDIKPMEDTDKYG